MDVAGYYCRTKFLVAIAFVVVLFMGGSQVRELIITSPNVALSSTIVRVITPSAMNKTKVLFLTYMRGGSSLVGELINQNPNATYWFEPIDGVYSDLYATVHGWFPLDLLDTTDGEYRELPEFEENAIVEQMKNLYSCNIDGMTTDTLGHFAMTRIVQKRFEDYASCLQQLHEGVHKVQAPYYCKSRTVNLCPRVFKPKDTSLAKCYHCLHVSPGSPFFSGDREPSDTNLAMDSHCKHVSVPFSQYSTCMKTYREAMSRCTPLLKDICDKSSIIGVKTIRLRADFVNKLMQELPDLKLVHLMRDPRAVVVSRQHSGLLSSLSEKHVTEEATRLCERISADVNALQRIIHQFPERVLQVTYEDFVVDSLVQAKRFYKFIGKDLPTEVTQSMTDHIHSDVQGGPFSTSRKNGTKSLYKWRTSLNPEQIKEISNSCLTVLQRYGYPLS